MKACVPASSGLLSLHSCTCLLAATSGAVMIAAHDPGGSGPLSLHTAHDPEGSGLLSLHSVKHVLKDLSFQVAAPGQAGRLGWTQVAQEQTQQRGKKKRKEAKQGKAKERVSVALLVCGAGHEGRFMHLGTW
eukprot:1141055-Pelagomonas_calceolata.AAC.4